MNSPPNLTWSHTSSVDYLGSWNSATTSRAHTRCIRQDRISKKSQGVDFCVRRKRGGHRATRRVRTNSAPGRRPALLPQKRLVDTFHITTHPKTVSVFQFQKLRLGRRLKKRILRLRVGRLKIDLGLRFK